MKKSLLVLLGMMMILWLAACSGDGGNEETSGDDNASEETADNGDSEGAESGDEEVTLRIAWWGSQPRHDYTLEVIKLYEEQHPNVTIEPEYASWDDYWQKLAPQAAANELPDIVQMDLSYLSQYAENNQLADLSPFIGSNIDDTNISQNAIDGGKVGDGVYGFNLGVNALSFHYNPEIMSELGYDEFPEEWTWEEYQEISQKAVDAGYYFDNGLKADVFFNYYLRQNGKRLYAEDGSGLGYEDDQLFVDFFKMVQEQVESGATPTPDFLAQLAGPEDDPVVKGEGVGIFQWSNQFVGLEDISESSFEFAPTPGPNVDQGLFLKPSMFFSVSENSEQKEAAADFINFFINDVEANKLILGDRGVPVSSEVKDALLSEVSEAQAKVFEYVAWAEENSTAMGAPDPAGAGEVIELIDGLQEQIAYGEISPEDAATQFRTQAESILGN
ncbi:extracellular solute-binding protein [Gracilibacillus caseinilyticus]|uniref:Extracellular solute-binding protein n=1 Tax=Gracilibacillus caseinilyticus TaxID=2932256 RepID=A0ABY4EUW9_9BACI|nr:extracellular solute-binding protein [Gracilibacillus caseinilyticus]UOQ48201.1 extracellular solute-binding protein [Gracilibacillus caseinilyticus]